MGLTRVTWNLILFGPDSVFSLFVFNIWINGWTLKCWEITLPKSGLPSFLHVRKKLEVTSGPFLDGALPLQPHTVLTTRDCFLALQLPVTITPHTAVFLWWKGSVCTVLFKVGKTAVFEKAVLLVQWPPNRPWGYLTLWPWVKRWGHVHQRVASHYPDFSNWNWDMNPNMVIFTFKWLSPYRLQ